jgi:hypothetical protein
MLKVAILDANTTGDDTTEMTIHLTNSMVANWLAWEFDSRNVPISTDYATSDILFLVYAGAVDWLPAVKRFLKKHAIPSSPSARNRKPYIITGGAIDVAPFVALSVVDALAVGEAYHFIRSLIDLLENDSSLEDIRGWIVDYPHAIEQSQLSPLAEDPDYPYLLASPPPKLASPDDWVDWEGQPLIRNDDKVVRIVAAKGCHLRCKFCATTYRQTYRIHPRQGMLAKQVEALNEAGERVSLITNDVGVLPALHLLANKAQLDSQSLTIKSVRDPENLEAIIEANTKIIRFGVEGVSERVRQAFGKPIDDAELIDILAYIHSRRRNSQLFFIVGSPYETREDWVAHERFVRALFKRVEWGVLKFKYTAFQPNPPTPLARFLPARQYYRNMGKFKDDYLNDFVSRHGLLIWARKPDNLIDTLADVYHVPRAYFRNLYHDEETIDLLPTVDMARRAKWEVIDWHLSPDKRWNLGNSYARTMGAMERAQPQYGLEKLEA